MESVKFVFICGLSGSGKSIALNTFEDAGYFCVDSLPAPLVGNFIDFALAESSKESSTNTRYGLLIPPIVEGCFQSFSTAIKKLREQGHQVTLFFLDADDDVLVRRFSETRRPHPLLQTDLSGNTLRDALAKEREQLTEFRGIADRIVDTSSYSPHDLRRIIRDRYLDNLGLANLELSIVSFGFKYGVPTTADLVVDVRFLPNPHFVPELKPKTGNDKEVSDFVFKHEEANEFVDKYHELLRFLLPKYQQEGKHYLTVAIGCTGGKHRSVAIANKLSSLLADAKCEIITRHRDLS